MSISTHKRHATIALAITSALLLAGCAGTLGTPAAQTTPATPVPLSTPKAGLPNIVVVDAGGTLVWTAKDRISYQHYGDTQVDLKKIVSDLYPELGKIANVSVVKTDSLGSSSQVTLQNMYDVSRTVDQQLANKKVDGVVVTAGTSVLEEDAYFLDLTVRSPKPVVVTGSMHQYGTFTYDAYTNLFSSIRLAASKKTTCYGTTVLMNDQFFSARDVTKTDGFRMDTFQGGAYGTLGVVNENVIRTMNAPARVTKCGAKEWTTPFDLSKINPTDIAPVQIVYSSAGASADTLTGAANNAKGLVTAGFGPGDLSKAQSDAEGGLKNVVLVSTSRTGGEGYYDSGNGNVINAGDLLPQKARLLLALALTFSSDRAQVRSWFNTIGDPEFDFSHAIK